MGALGRPAAIVRAAIIAPGCGVGGGVEDLAEGIAALRGRAVTVGPMPILTVGPMVEDPSVSTGTLSG